MAISLRSLQRQERNHLTIVIGGHSVGSTHLT